MTLDLFRADETDNRLADIEFTVLRDYYSNDAQESAGKATYDGADRTQRYWVCRVDQVFQDWSSEVPEEITLKFGLGKGWHPVDDEATSVRHEDDTDEEKPKYFDIKSRWGQFVALISGQRKTWVAPTVLVMDGGDEEIDYDMTSVMQNLRERELDDPRDAHMFEGTRWRGRGLGFKYPARKGEQERDVRSTCVPVAYLGYVDVSDEVPRSVEEAGKPTVSVEDVVANLGSNLPADDVAKLTPETVATLTDLVNKSTSFAAFGRQALLLDDVKSTTSLKSLIGDKVNGPWSLRP